MTKHRVLPKKKNLRNFAKIIFFALRKVSQNCWIYVFPSAPLRAAVHPADGATGINGRKYKISCFCMLNFSKKYWVVIFFVIFFVGFATGYLTMTFDIKNGILGRENNRNFWEIFNPL